MKETIKQDQTTEQKEIVVVKRQIVFEPVGEFEKERE